MNIELFKKALYYYYGGFVFKEDEAKDTIFFDVDGEKLTFSYKEKKGFLDILCTCQHCSLKSKYNALCSRKIACILYLSHQYRKKQLKKE